MSKFIGYVVHLEESDEFLALHESPAIGAEGYGWSKFPGKAIRYKSKAEAQKVADGHGKGAIVCELHDEGNRYIVACQ